MAVTPATASLGEVRSGSGCGAVAVESGEISSGVAPKDSWMPGSPCGPAAAMQRQHVQPSVCTATDSVCGGGGSHGNSVVPPCSSAATGELARDTVRVLRGSGEGEAAPKEVEAAGGALGDAA